MTTTYTGHRMMWMRVITAFLILVMTVLLFTPIHATEYDKDNSNQELITETGPLVVHPEDEVNLKSQIFNDVNPSDWFFDTVMRMTEDGLVEGYGDGTFRPNDYVSGAEAMVILQRAFQDPEQVPGEGEWETYPWHLHDWVPTYTFMGKYHSDICRGVACELLLLAKETFIYNQNLYSDETIKEVVSDYTFTCKQYGYIVGFGNGKLGQNEMLTRAQFCTMLYRAIYENPNPEIPELPDSIVTPEMIGYGDHESGNLQSLVDSLMVVPKEIRETFVNRGYRLLAAPAGTYEDCWKKYFYSPYIDSVGAFSSSSKMILLNDLDKNTVLHEFGHFVEHIYVRYTELRDLFENESEQNGVSIVCNRDYCKTNESEFFAEAFKAYHTRSEKLKEFAPLTYEFLEKLHLEKIYGVA